MLLLYCVMASPATQHLSKANKLGEGSYASVYEVQDQTSGERYALKEIKAECGGKKDESYKQIL